MSDIISISSNDLGTRKKVKIDGEDFIIRKLGAGEELDLSQIGREILKLLEKVTNDKDWTDDDSNKFEELKKKSLEIYAKTLDDGGDGSKSKALIERLSDDERNAIYRIAFPKVEVKEDADEEEADQPS